MSQSRGDDAARGPFVRPFVVTGGRTRPPVAIALDALVMAPAGSEDGIRLGPEHRQVVELCATPQSIADVAADLGTAIGVATVLVGDLLVSGRLTLHRATASRTDVALLERIAAGVRDL